MLKKVDKLDKNKKQIILQSKKKYIKKINKYLEHVEFRLIRKKILYNV